MHKVLHSVPIGFEVLTFAAFSVAHSTNVRGLVCLRVGELDHWDAFPVPDIYRRPHQKLEAVHCQEHRQMKGDMLDVVCWPTKMFRAMLLTGHSLDNTWLRMFQAGANQRNNVKQGWASIGSRQTTATFDQLEPRTLLDVRS